MRVWLSVLGADNTERGYNTRCKSFYSAMIGACAKLTALMNCANSGQKMISDFGAAGNLMYI